MLVPVSPTKETKITHGKNVFHLRDDYVMTEIIYELVFSQFFSPHKYRFRNGYLSVCYRISSFALFKLRPNNILI